MLVIKDIYRFMHLPEIFYVGEVVDQQRVMPVSDLFLKNQSTRKFA